MFDALLCGYMCLYIIIDHVSVSGYMGPKGLSLVRFTSVPRHYAPYRYNITKRKSFPHLEYAWIKILSFIDMSSFEWAKYNETCRSFQLAGNNIILVLHLRFLYLYFFSTISSSLLCLTFTLHYESFVCHTCFTPS